jgi:cytochrome c oxidase subunit IV
VLPERRAGGARTIMSEHIVYPRVYVTIFLVLMVGTALTVLAAFQDFHRPWLNATIALTIAVVKATFVVLYFMHVRYSGRLVWLVIASALFWLVIMFALTISDYSSRSWMPM